MLPVSHPARLRALLGTRVLFGERTHVAPDIHRSPSMDVPLLAT